MACSSKSSVSTSSSSSSSSSPHTMVVRMNFLTMIMMMILMIGMTVVQEANAFMIPSHNHHCNNNNHPSNAMAVPLPPRLHGTTTTTALYVRNPSVMKRNKKRNPLTSSTSTKKKNTNTNGINNNENGGLLDGSLFNKNKEEQARKNEEHAAAADDDDNNDEKGSDWMQQYMEQRPDVDVKSLALMGAAATAVVYTALSSSSSSTMMMIPQYFDTILGMVQSFLSNPTASLDAVVHSVESMGPLGIVYFGGVYTLAEVLAIPAFPLTASAGYLFGVGQGTAVVLLSASMAAAISFVIGRTVLRTFVEDLLQEYPEFSKLDHAIGKKGFKLMLLLRLSPIFPFALSNYLYGASSVGFWPYFFATMIGFTPGTVAYVYSGTVGKALTLGDGSAQPWYIYLGAFAVLGGLLKIIADVATGIIQEIQEEDDE